MPINAKLVVVGGEVKTAEIKLRLPCTIGRGRGCTIMLPQALVSRQHCELSESGGQVIVRDLGSLNGTFINNQKISAPAAVRSEELLTIGTVTFRVVYDSVEAGGPPPGPAPAMKSAASPAASSGEDASQPLEIGDFEFEETLRTSDTDVPVDNKFPGVVPAFQAGASTAPSAAAPSPPKPPPTAPVPVAKPAAPVAKPAAPVTTPAAPLAKPVPAPAPPAAEKSEEGKEEEEDDFQDFLKSLGK